MAAVRPKWSVLGVVAAIVHGDRARWVRSCRSTSGATVSWVGATVSWVGYAPTMTSEQQGDPSMKRSPLASLRRTVRRGATWRAKESGDHSLEILSFTSPLRYDVVVRAEFFRWLADNEDGRSDADVVDGARQLPYRVWFTEVAMARFRPWVLDDPTVLEGQFAERVTSARRLAASIAEHGFDPSHPVTLRRSTGHQVADSGARIDKSLHVGDGGHRLAFLLSRGAALEPWMYRVDPRPMPVLDNTAILARALQLDEKTHAAFIGHEFVNETVHSFTGLRAAVSRAAPDRLWEVDSVLEAHGRMPKTGSRHHTMGEGHG